MGINYSGTIDTPCANMVFSRHILSLRGSDVVASSNTIYFNPISVNATTQRCGWSYPSARQTGNSYKTNIGFRIYNGENQVSYGNALRNTIISLGSLPKTGWSSGGNWSESAGINSISTSSLFNASNNTDIDVTLTAKMTNIEDYDYDSYQGSYYVGMWNGSTDVGTIKVTLNAPPTFTSSQVTCPDPFAIGNVASVKVANLSAKFGGNISEVKFTIGNQSTTSINAAGVMSITLNSSGEKLCKVEVTDSRGQKTTTALDPIWVWDVVPQWIKPVTNRENERTRTSYVDMTRIATDCAYVGGLVQKTSYSINDIVFEDEWDTIVAKAQSIDATVTNSTRYDNLNKIESAFISSARFVLGTSKLGKGVI